MDSYNYNKIEDSASVAPEQEQLAAPAPTPLPDVPQPAPSTGVLAPLGHQASTRRVPGQLLAGALALSALVGGGVGAGATWMLAAGSTPVAATPAAPVGIASAAQPVAQVNTGTIGDIYAKVSPSV